MRSRRSCRQATSSCLTWAEVSVRRWPARRLHCRLEVSNSGTGVPPESVSRLLEPFQRRQARSHSHQTGEGVGLGLAIVTSIAHAHAATMHVRANADGGLTVEVDFPPIVRYGRQSAQDLQRSGHRAPNGSCLCHAVANRQAPPTCSNRPSSSCPSHGHEVAVGPGPSVGFVHFKGRQENPTSEPRFRTARADSLPASLLLQDQRGGRQYQNVVPTSLALIPAETRYPDTASIDGVCGW